MRAAFLLLLALWATLAGGSAVEKDGDPVLLVAKPHMPDPRFAETVIVVAFPQDAGAMGVILNHPAGMTLGELFGPDRPELGAHEDLVYFGGPVQPDGMLFLFRNPEHPLKALPVAPGVYLSGDGKIFDQLVQRPAESRDARFFAGYSGWAEGQLDNEIRRGDWYVLPVDPDLLFDEDVAGLWKKLLDRARAQTAGVARAVPSNR